MYDLLLKFPYRTFFLLQNFAKYFFLRRRFHEKLTSIFNTYYFSLNFAKSFHEKLKTYLRNFAKGLREKC